MKIVTKYESFIAYLESIIAPQGQSNIAEKANVTRSSMCNYLNEKIIPRADTMLQICKAAGLDVYVQKNTTQGHYLVAYQLGEKRRVFPFFVDSIDDFFEKSSFNPEALSEIVLLNASTVFEKDAELIEAKNELMQVQNLLRKLAAKHVPIESLQEARKYLENLESIS